MTKEKIKNRIEKLREEISGLRYKYHVTNDPSVTDDVYESLTRELVSLEKENPEFQDPNSAIFRVAGSALPDFKKFTHASRMLSLNDAFGESEVSDWETRIRKLLPDKKYSYFCEVKLDGLAVSLTYKDGKFIQGATRGDGFVGEDITENLKMIDNIPLELKGKIKGTLVVRGEVVMSKNVFTRLNKKNKSVGKTVFANTRNAAAGSVRQLDPKLVKERHLDFFAYEIAEFPKSLNIATHSQKHKLLRELGFVVEENEKKAKNLEEVFEFVHKIGDKRASLPYSTDGVVIAVDEIDLARTLGIVGKAPRYAVAYKFPAERATTQVLDITVNVGRTGVLTPLAHFVPTIVAGSKVSKATLHNMDQIERLDINIGDTVVIQKAGDIIPEVVQVLKNMRTGKEKKFKMPKICPVCESQVQMKDIFYYCTNKNCPARNSRQMIHFVNAFEIYEIGPKILDRLKEEGIITDIADLFTLEEADLSGLERFGDKSASNIISSIENHKKVLLWRFIYALGIMHVGEQTARDLAHHFETLPKFLNAKLAEFESIENIGPIVANSIANFLSDKHNLALVQKLIKNGVKIERAQINKASTLSGKIFVLTGTLPTMSREMAKKIILENGGKVSSSVSAKTDFVLAGESAGSKLEDARKLGVKVISEEEFQKMV